MPDLLATALSDAFADVLDLVWPRACAGCSRAGRTWCADCAGQLSGPAVRTWPTPCPPGLPPLWAVTAYDGAVRGALVAWKDDGRHDLTSALGAALARSVRAALAAASGQALEAARGSGPVWVVPMPSRRRARRARGADPVRLLARRAVAVVRREVPAAHVVPALRHRRAVADQSGLGAAERAANLAGALEVPPDLRRAVTGARCLLVDDIVTTGATLAEAAAALRRAGAHPLGAAVVAATQRTSTGRARPR